MPKILVVTLFHMVTAIVSGLILALSVFGAGFSDSRLVHDAYKLLLIFWQVMNAPAGIYLLQMTEPNWAIFGLLQVIGSFIWANIFGLMVTSWKVCRQSAKANDSDSI